MSFSCMKMHNYSQTKHSLEDKKKRKKEKKAWNHSALLKYHSEVKWNKVREGTSQAIVCLLVLGSSHHLLSSSTWLIVKLSPLSIEPPKSLYYRPIYLCNLSIPLVGRSSLKNEVFLILTLCPQSGKARSTQQVLQRWVLGWNQFMILLLNRKCPNTAGREEGRGLGRRTLQQPRANAL
jgi:hypothetical protein